MPCASAPCRPRSPARSNPAQQVVKIVNEELVAILGGQTRTLSFAKNPPTVIMLAGLQGAGKTTLAGKLALHLKSQGHTPLLVAADLQRPNAVTQLQVVGERAGVPVFAPHPGNQGSDDVLPLGADPVAVAREGLATAKAKQHDVLIVDTAGRLGVDAELMQQASDIRDALDPDEILFVIDAMIGQDAVTTAQAFADGVGFTGVVLSKLDGDARGGAALSVASVTGKPIMYASTGEKLTEFEVFHPDRMASRILDMGDVLTLIEQAEKAFDADQAEEMADKLASGEDFTLEDFLVQMQQLRNAGPLKKMIGMLPGMGQMREALDNFDEREVDRIEAIIRSMTPAERRAPKIINGSRRSRIAAGSGTKPSDVNQLLERFDGAQKMMRQMAKGGGMPGMPRAWATCPAWAARSRAAAPRRRCARSRASPATRPSGPSRSAASPASRAAPQGSAFGLAPKAEPTQPADDRAAGRSGPLPRRTLTPRGPAPAGHGRPRRRPRGR